MPDNKEIGEALGALVRLSDAESKLQAKAEERRQLALRENAIPFTYDALVQILLERPGLSHQQYGELFGRGSGWFASVLASPAFQRALDPVRDQILDPSISATLDERFKALAFQGLAVLQVRLDSKECGDQTVLKAVELGLKASGVGLAPPPAADDKPAGPEAVAARILEAMAKAKAQANGAAVDVVAKEVKA